MMIGQVPCGWPPAAFGAWRGGDQSLRTYMLRNEIGMLSQTIAGAFDLDDDGMVQQAIEQRRGDDRITERLMMPPFWIAWYAIGAVATDGLVRR